RTIIAGSIFGRVSHDAGVDESPFVQSGTDAADAPVHHVRGGDDIHSGRSLGKRLLFQDTERGVVDDVATCVDYAVLTMAGVGVKRDIAHYPEFGEFFF